MIIFELNHMSWKIELGKTSEPYIIGKRWVKKQIPKSNRISKALHKENSCPGDIYYIGKHYYQNSNEMIDLWVCMETGTILTKPPNYTKIVPPKPKPQPVPTQPKFHIVPEKKEISKSAVKPKPKETKTKPEEEIKPKAQPEVKITKVTKDTPVSEVKGIGATVYEKLAVEGIKTIGDLLGKHSQEIAAMIGRKSDAQIKTWQENAKEMLK